MTEVPMVSIVIPMRNEIDSITECIETFDGQTHPTDALDVIVVDGRSDDGSLELVESLALTRPWLRVIDNPERKASAAFNRGIEAARGDVICIVSSHGSVGPDFVDRSLATLTETGAGGVGGKLVHSGRDPVARAIGLAMTSPLGMASPFRYADSRREVDTIGHPMYRAEVLAEVGGFDESLDRNSDYELNQRIRNAGHVLVFDPQIVTTYYPRATLSTLARQFWDYGRWKGRIVRSDPSNMRWRHAVPPAFVACLGVSPLLCRNSIARRAYGAIGAGYFLVHVTALRDSQPARSDADPTSFVASFPVMHATWGAGFLRGIVAPMR